MRQADRTRSEAGWNWAEATLISAIQGSMSLEQCALLACVVGTTATMLSVEDEVTGIGDSIKCAFERVVDPSVVCARGEGQGADRDSTAFGQRAALGVDAHPPGDATQSYSPPTLGDALASLKRDLDSFGPAEQRQNWEVQVADSRALPDVDLPNVDGWPLSEREMTPELVEMLRQAVERAKSEGRLSPELIEELEEIVKENETPIVIAPTEVEPRDGPERIEQLLEELRKPEQAEQLAPWLDALESAREGDGVTSGHSSRESTRSVGSWNVGVVDAARDVVHGLSSGAILGGAYLRYMGARIGSLVRGEAPSMPTLAETDRIVDDVAAYLGAEPATNSNWRTSASLTSVAFVGYVINPWLGLVGAFVNGKFVVDSLSDD